MKKVLFISLCIIAFLGYGCKSTAPAAVTVSDVVNVLKNYITKGKTTQGEILNLFGSATQMSKNSAGEAVWNYKNVMAEVKGKKATFRNVTNGTPFDMQVTFDGNNVVKEYNASTPTR